ncbi:MAG: thiamine ABC transporter substrate-binding protein [Thermotogaceae bacterium]|nr:thiamine ABC transporter substrate-binding protein [Thermotogaceae bacterium]
MRKVAILVLILTAVLYSAQLVVYTYDSMVSGLAKKIEPLFEEKYGIDVKFVSFGDAGNIISRILLEGKKTQADVILGLDQNLLLKAVERGILFPYKPKNISRVKKELLKKKEDYAVPFDYGAIAIVYNTETIKEPPKSFEDLLKPQYKRRIVVEDPRTSSTGLAFLLWTIAAYGDNFTEYWKKLKDNLLTVTAGWDEAFEMLESGEADMMVSYLTDSAYSHYYYDSGKYAPAVFKEGMFTQVEYVGICRFTDDLDAAKKFVDFMLSEEVQELIPLNQWMLPVVEVKLPEVFEKYVPKVEKYLFLDAEKVEKNLERWLKDWEKIMVGY